MAWRHRPPLAGVGRTRAALVIYCRLKPRNCHVQRHLHCYFARGPLHHLLTTVVARGLGPSSLPLLCTATTITGQSLHSVASSLVYMHAHHIGTAYPDNRPLSQRKTKPSCCRCPGTRAAGGICTLAQAARSQIGPCRCCCPRCACGCGSPLPCPPRQTQTRPAPTCRSNCTLTNQTYGYNSTSPYAYATKLARPFGPGQ